MEIENAPKPGQIFSLIPKVMNAVPEIGKNRKNQQQGYAFRGVDDVMASFQPVLAKHGIFFTPEVLSREVTERQTKNGGTLIYTTLHVAFTFYAPDGSSVHASTIGEAMDTADKSSNKAMSAALKYALVQVFCVPTESMDDADYTTHEVAPAAAKAAVATNGNGAKKPAASKPKPVPAGFDRKATEAEILSLYAKLDYTVPQLDTMKTRLAAKTDSEVADILVMAQDEYDEVNPAF